MPKETEKNQTTALNDRRNNIRERIATEASWLQSEKVRREENRLNSSKKQPSGYNAILQQEREFEKSISNLSPEIIKQKRLDRIEQVKQWYREAKISDNYLVERARQLYHNLPGDIPSFFKRPVMDQKSFYKTLPKDGSVNKEDAYKEYNDLAVKEKRDFEHAREEFSTSVGEGSPEYRDANTVLDEARYKEFKSDEEKALGEKREEEERKEFEKYENVLQRANEIAQKEIEQEKFVNAINKKIEDTIKIFESQSLERCKKELEDIKSKSNIAPEDYPALLKNLMEHDREYEKQVKDLKMGNNDVFNDKERNYLKALGLEKDSEEKVENKEKPVEEKAVEEKQAEVPSEKKVVKLDKYMQSGLLETCNATVDYIKPRLQYGLNYAIAHHGRMDKSILMPAFDELSELTVITHDTEAEYNKQNEAYQREFSAHTKAKPWIFAKWFNTDRWQKWETKDKEFQNRGNILNATAQKIAEQNQLKSQYVAGLKTAGVSQAMIDKCSTYENVVIGAQISDLEIKNEVKRCKEKFDKNIDSLREKGNVKEIANIYKERMDCLNGMNNIRSLREVQGHLSKEEISELYPENQVEKNAPIGFNERMNAFEKGDMGFTELFYNDFNVDYEKEVVDINNGEKDFIIGNKENVEQGKEELKGGSKLFYDQRELKNSEDEIFAGETEFALQMEMYGEIKEIDNTEDLQNMLAGNIKDNNINLSERVEESKAKQRVSSLESN